MRIALIDLSGVFRMHWHASEQDGISAAFNKTLQSVTGFAAGFDAVGICVDSPPYKRSAIAPDYKAHREKAPAMLHEQLARVVDQLDRDGYHVLRSPGYEADDIIATVCMWAKDADVVVYSADKDMLQLVRDAGEQQCSIKVISSATGVGYDRDAVNAKFGIGPSLIPDLLALMGDKSDGIAGIPGVGPKTAAAWLNLYGSAARVAEKAAELEPARFRELVAANRDAILQSLTLTRLMTDAPIDPAVILEPKTPKAVEPEAPPAAPDEPAPAPMPLAVTASPVVQVDYERALEPRDSLGAVKLAQYLYASRMFGQFPTMEAILATILAGRQYGLGAVQSLNGFHNIKGKQSASAQLIVGLVKRHPACRYFSLIESAPTHATYETHRVGEPAPTRMTYTVEMAKQAGLTGKDNWRNDPGAMCLARAGSRLARAVYPDITCGLYCPDEIEDI